MSSDDKLRAVLKKSYTKMNADGRFARNTPQDITLFQALLDATPNPNRLSVVDFGCGPQGGIIELVKGVTCVGHDPYVPQYNGPWSQQRRVAIYSSDVLEHMLIPDIRSFVYGAISTCAALIYLEIATRPANKLLSNGLNAHITLHPTQWWCGFLTGLFDPRYDVVLASDNLLEGVCTLAFRRKELR